MANVLKRDKQEQVIRGLVEGMSVRSVERMSGVHRDTIIRLMLRVGEGCEGLMDAEMRELCCARVQVDEIWGYVAKKQRHVKETDDQWRVGDFYTFVALDSDTTLIPCFFVGKRTSASARLFMDDLASRISGRIQLSSDAFFAYAEAVDAAFGADVDYGQIVKSYEATPAGGGRYSPPKVVAVERMRVWGDPDPEHISTSHVERQNLTMRMQIRRLTRLTNGFSKKAENLRASVALHFAHYNFVRVHKTLKATPAMRAGVTNRLWNISELLSAVSGEGSN